MQLLTVSGYKNIEDCVIGEQLIAYEVGTGNVIINELLGKQWFSPDMFVDEYSEPEPLFDEDGNPLLDEDGNQLMSEPVLIKTKEEIFTEVYGDLNFYKINDTWTVFKNQSIWANLNVVHGLDLQIGDVVYDDDDNDVTITSLVEETALGWWRLTVSGDHSYIADNLTLHNASRYWVGGGASANWNATGNTNWGSTSGGTNNASVPTSADDVIFDGAGTNGNTNSTISAAITILSLDVQTGYTATMTHNAVLTIAGNWTFGGTYTIAGTNQIIISAASTITSNGKTWPNALRFDNTNTKTLVGDLTVGGLFTSQGNSTINKTTNEKLILNSGITVNVAIGGSIAIYLKGGTWSGTAGLNIDFYIDGNITISGSVLHGGFIFTHISGTVTTTGSTVQFNGLTTITSGTITFNNVTLGINNNTKTLVGNLNINGLLTVSNSLAVNKTTSETVTTSGGITMSAALSGTADIYLTGGTWSGANTLSNNLYINGNTTISSVVFAGANLTYQSGTVTNTGTIEFSGNTTITNGSIIWNNVVMRTNTRTIVGNFIINGTLTLSNASTLNKTTNEIVQVYNGIVSTNTINGTADIYLKGGRWFNTAILSNNLYFDGDVTINSPVSFGGSILSYLSGKINAINGTLSITASATINGFNKVPLKATTITQNITLTMDRFFVGTPAQINQITSTGSNYTIQFIDNFEKMARFVAVSGATFSRPLQLINTTSPRFNTNRSTNAQGIRYYNQSPNGFARNAPMISDTMTVSALGLIADPNFIKQG